MKATYYKSESATCTQEFFDMVDNTYKALTITPGMPHDEIMFNAGQRELIEWMRTHIRNTVQDNKINRTID